MSKVKIAFYCLIGLAVAGIGFGWTAYHRLREAPETLRSVLPKDGDVSLNRIHHVATRDGTKEWTLDAKSAHYQKADNKTVFKDIAATFYLENGDTISLDCRDGVLMTDTKDVEVWGDVVARSGAYELNTERLRYEHKTQTMITDTPVVIKGNRMEIAGSSMAFNLRTEQVVVRGRVKAVFKDFTL